MSIGLAVTFKKLIHYKKCSCALLVLSKFMILNAFSKYKEWNTTKCGPTYNEFVCNELTDLGFMRFFAWV